MARELKASPAPIGKRPTKPGGLLRIRAGQETTLRGSRGDYIGPESWDHGIVEIADSGEWKAHPGFPTHEQGGQQSFLIELVSNVVEYSLQSHLSNYAGKVPFCTRAHRGDDGLGIAMRRTADGRRVAVECDPERCAFRRLHLATKEEKPEVLNQIKAQDEKAYPYIAGKCDACKPNTNLIFALLLLDGKTYAHAPTEFCVFHSTSDMNHGRFRDTLQHLWRQTHGNLRGLRLNLVYEPFESRFGRTTPAWNLRVPEGTDFSAQQIAAAERRKLMNLDYDALVSNTDTKALALINHEKSLAVVAREQGIELAEFVRQSLDDQADFADYQAEYIDPASVSLLNHDPLVLALSERIQLAYPYQVRMPMKFGQDTYRCMLWLKEQADKVGVYVGDIWQSYTATLPGYGAPVKAEPAPVVPPAVTSEPEDAEFEDVPERSLDEMLDASRGKA